MSDLEEAPYESLLIRTISLLYDEFWGNEQNSETKLNLPIIIAKDLQEECSICKEFYKDGEEICVSLCSHKFHFKCLNDWVQQKSSCPLCRTEINFSRD